MSLKVVLKAATEFANILGLQAMTKMADKAASK